MFPSSSNTNGVSLLLKEICADKSDDDNDCGGGGDMMIRGS